MQKAADKYGVKLLYAIAERDPQKMRSNIDSFVNQGANMIVDFNVLPDVGATIAGELKKQNIPMLSIDSVYTGAYFFGANNLEAGKVAGRYLAQKAKQQWNGGVDYLVQLYSESFGPEVKQRNSGIYDGLVETVKLDASRQIWINLDPNDPTDVKGKIQDFLTAHPQAHHILIGVENDERALTALAGIETAGRMNDCLMVSHNCDPIAIDNFRKDKANAWVGSVNYTPDKYGDYIIPICIDILNGKNVPIMNYNKHFVVGRENVATVFPK
jgi:ribose transport system substrate-binding protein